MSDTDFSLLDLFRAEVKSHTATLGQGLLELEREPKGHIADADGHQRGDQRCLVDLCVFVATHLT